MISLVEHFFIKNPLTKGKCGDTVRSLLYSYIYVEKTFDFSGCCSRFHRGSGFGVGEENNADRASQSSKRGRQDT